VQTTENQPAGEGKKLSNMNSLLNLNTTNRLFRSPLRRSYLWCGLFLIALLVACFGLAPTAQALLPAPPPDGGYPGFNTAEGQGALFSLTTGTGNSAIGAFSLFSNTDGGTNTAVGAAALALNTHGMNNTALGGGALFVNSTGGFNTATGVSALQNNTTAFNNTATGFQALFDNTTGGNNTATGLQALTSNSTGGNNTATGFQALFANSSGGFNTADGWQTLANNTTAFSNVGTGFQALLSTTSGSANTGCGSQALTSNTTGGGNTAAGAQALFSNNGSRNIAVGVQAGADLTTGSDNIDIGNRGIVGESSTIRIGTVQTATFIAGISGASVVDGDAVFVLGNGKLGTVTAVSSARFKEEIKPMNQASEVILALKPVTFRYKKEFDAARTPRFGLVAEEVEKINPDLVKRDREGKVQTVRYDAVNAMLLNEFLKEHRKVEELGAIIAKQQKQIEALTTGLQKVSDQLELSKPAPQTVLNQ
jgi:Chaperone of endosialidase